MAFETNAAAAARELRILEDAAASIAEHADALAETIAASADAQIAYTRTVLPQSVSCRRRLAVLISALERFEKRIRIEA